MAKNDIVDEFGLWENKYFLQEMKSRVDGFENGKTQGISWEEVKAKINRTFKCPCLDVK
jgi:hypothetical protein